MVRDETDVRGWEGSASAAAAAGRRTVIGGGGGSGGASARSVPSGWVGFDWAGVAGEISRAWSDGDDVVPRALAAAARLAGSGYSLALASVGINLGASVSIAAPVRGPFAKAGSARLVGHACDRDVRELMRRVHARCGAIVTEEGLGIDLAESWRQAAAEPMLARRLGLAAAVLRVLTVHGDGKVRVRLEISPRYDERDRMWRTLCSCGIGGPEVISGASTARSLHSSASLSGSVLAACAAWCAGCGGEDPQAAELAEMCNTAEGGPGR